MNRPVLVVMAAGMGSRYGGMKQIDPVGPNGEVIIDYTQLFHLLAQFFDVIADDSVVDIHIGSVIEQV